MSYRIVTVDWWDTVDSAGWDTKDEVSPKLVKQLGWLVNQDSECVKLADTLSEGEYYGITAIPSGCVELIVDVMTGTPESY
mgnify:CR=1 FL=1